MPDPLPLQSHNHIVDKWYPPEPSRFVSYDHRDECWMRPLGLGTVKRELAELYDVRDRNGDIIGWSHTSPLNSDNSILAFIRSPNMTHLAYWIGGPVEQPKDELVHVYKKYWVSEKRLFVGWEVSSVRDAIILIEGEWMLPRHEIREYPIDINAYRFRYAIYPDDPLAGVI